MPVESSFISLQNSLFGPRPYSNLHKLTDEVEKTGQHQTTLRSARVYADISAKAWDLQGSFASLQTAQHLQEFYDQQRVFLQTYSASLESMRREFLEFTYTAFTASALIPGERETVRLIKPSVGRMAEHLITTLNTYDENYGYIFAGAQIDQKPINPQLLTDLTSPYGPNLTLGTIQDYFVNGNTPDDQSPLILYADTHKISTLPLRANDLQGLFQTIYDFLALPHSPTQEQVQVFHQAMDKPMGQIVQAFAEIAGDLKGFDRKEEILSKLAECHANFRDQQLEVDPLEAAVAFNEASRALQAFFEHMIFTVSMARHFHDLTLHVMV